MFAPGFESRLSELMGMARDLEPVSRPYYSGLERHMSISRKL